MNRTMMRIAIFALMCFATFAQAGENAQLPYKLLYDMQKVQARLTGTYTNIRVFMKLSSRLPEVKPADLQLCIDTKSGKVPVALNPDGIFAVPMRDDLLSENPFLIVNQPKGTMALEWSSALIFPKPLPREEKGSKKLLFNYRALMQGVEEYEPIQREMLQVYPGAPQLTIQGLKLIFTDAKKDTVVVIRAKGGDRLLKPDANGEVVMPLEKTLLEENPEVVLPAMPKKIDIAGRRNDA